jgi:biotin operon repressor
MVIRTLGLTGAVMLALSSPAATAADADWQQRVGEALGKPGQEMPSGVYRVGLPRTDLHVKLDGVDIKPGLALGSWLAFKKEGAQDAMVMGDLVLTEAEVSPVMKKLEEGGIEITALHNHLLRNEPFTMYMHVLGHGDPVKLAATLHQALSLSKTPLEGAAASGSSPPAAAAQQPELGFDPAIIDRALGRKGKASGGVYAVSVPRAEPVKDGGMEVLEAMGSAIAINFQGTGGGKVATTGDFVLTAREVNPVLKALRENGIEVTALHNHMLDDQPRIFFMHFWANDDAEKVAKGLKAALDNVNVAKG